AAIPVRHVLGCVVHATCAVVEPGRGRHGFGRGLIVGEPGGGTSPRVRDLAARLDAAGFETTVSERIQADVWYKLWGNMTMNPMSALTGATCDRLLDDPLLDRFTLAIMAEAAAIGEKIGCPIRQSGEARNAVTRKLGGFKTSMLQDAEAGKPLEIDGLLTAVSEIGARVGVATPSTDALLGLTRGFAAGRGVDRAGSRLARPSGPTTSAACSAPPRSRPGAGSVRPGASTRRPSPPPRTRRSARRCGSKSAPVSRASPTASSGGSPGTWTSSPGWVASPARAAPCR